MMNYINALLNNESNEFDDVYLPELLQKAAPSNCFYIDTLPISASFENANKYDQVEEPLSTELQKKILNLLIKFWLYNDTFLKSDLLMEIHNTKNKLKINPDTLLKIHNHLPLSTERKLLKITELVQLKFILELSFDDKIDVLLVFEQFQFIVVASWSCFFAYINDLSKIKLIEKIINVEGLFLRFYKNEKELMSCQGDGDVDTHR